LIFFLFSPGKTCYHFFYPLDPLAQEDQETYA